MIRINLLSVREAKIEAGRRQETRIVALAAAGVVALLLTVEVISRMQVSPVVAEREALEKDVQALEIKTKELTTLETTRAELGEKLKTIEQLEKKRSGPMQVLSDLSHAMPDQVWLAEFAETGGATTITGYALDNQTIANFMRNVAQSPYFTKVDLVETSQYDQDGVQLKRFVVRARINYIGKASEPVPGEELKYPEPPKEEKARKKGARA